MTKTAELKVELLGHTVGNLPLIETYMETSWEANTAEDLIEFAGRRCYESFDKPNPKTRENADYIRNIIRQGHESVLEHVNVSLHISGVSRALTHELIRHRHFSYSQHSQRFVNEENAAFVVPPALRGNTKAIKIFEEATAQAVESYRDLVAALEAQGLPRKQVREAARSVLPNATETAIVVTGNLRAFRDFLPKRLSPAADREIREFSFAVLDELSTAFPVVFEDINEEFSS